MTRSISGGCLCGAIRYEISGDPVFQLLCFCRDCLAISGTDGYAGYMVNDGDFRHISGTPTVHTRSSAAGRQVHRHFCGSCGSNLWGQTELGLISVAAGTLDDPSHFKPTKKVFVDDAPPWARIPDHLEIM